MHFAQFEGEVHRLGFGAPVPLSAIHGYGLGPLTEALIPFGTRVIGDEDIAAMQEEVELQQLEDGSATGVHSDAAVLQQAMQADVEAKQLKKANKQAGRDAVGTLPFTFNLHCH